MKLEIEKVNISFNTIIVSRVELKCKGYGSMEDPLIIDSTNSLPENFRIRSSHLYINVFDCHAKQATLINVKNVTFNNSNLRGLTFIDSSDNAILDTKISRNLVFLNSHQNSIQSCSIRKLKLIKSNHNYFKKDTIIKVKYLESKDNVFDEVVISKRVLMRKTKLSSLLPILKNRFSLYPIFIIGVISIISISFMVAPLMFTLVLMLVFISFLIFTMVIPDIYRKKHKEKLNQPQ